MGGPRQPTAARDHTGDTALERIQARMRELVALLRLLPFLRGRAIAVHFPVGGQQLIVTHKLGVPAACFPIRFNYDDGAAMVGPAFAEWVPQPTSIDPRNQLALVCNQNNVTMVLWFYPRLDIAIPTGATQSA